MKRSRRRFSVACTHALNAANILRFTIRDVTTRTEARSA